MHDLTINIWESEKYPYVEVLDENGFVCFTIMKEDLFNDLNDFLEEILWAKEQGVTIEVNIK